jgi:RraA family protein
LGRCVGTVGIRAYHSNIPKAMCGPAFTVRVRPGDNLMIHKAMTLAQAGDVIVVDGAGDVTQALVGGLMRTSAIAKGFAGFVLDGAVRDTAEWAEGGMPIFARGHTHRGPTKDGPGEINIPIACAGLVVNPGDLILGDSDGVIALPVAILGDLHQRVRAHLAKEAMMRDAFSRNAFDPETFDSILRAKGVPI